MVQLQKGGGTRAGHAVGEFCRMLNAAETAIECSPIVSWSAVPTVKGSQGVKTPRPVANTSDMQAESCSNEMAEREIPKSEDDEPGAKPERLRQAPTLRLTRTGLIACLSAMVIGGLSVYSLFPEQVGGPPLPVNVRVELQPVETTSGVGALMTEVVVVENLIDDEIRKLSIDINGQYLYIQNSPLAANEVLVMPQRAFTDKRSHTRFDPVKYPIEDIVVAGQLPNSSRGVSKFEFDKESKSESESLD